MNLNVKTHPVRCVLQYRRLPALCSPEVRRLIPVDAVVCCLYADVNLQDGLIIHVGLTIALQGLISHGPAQEGLEGEWLQLQGSGGYK